MRKNWLTVFLAAAIGVGALMIGVGVVGRSKYGVDWTYDDFRNDLVSTVDACEITPEENSGMPCDMVDYSFTHYSVNGETLDYKYQDYIASCMIEFGVSVDYLPDWLSQIYQESGFDTSMVAKNGRDWGPCQLRDTWHEEFCELAGHPEFDVKTNIYDNLYIGTWLFCRNLKSSGYDLEKAVKKYYDSGVDAADSQYWSDVSKWYATVKKVD